MSIEDEIEAKRVELSELMKQSFKGPVYAAERWSHVRREEMLNLNTALVLLLAEKVRRDESIHDS